MAKTKTKVTKVKNCIATPEHISVIYQDGSVSQVRKNQPEYAEIYEHIRNDNIAAIETIVDKINRISRGLITVQSGALTIDGERMPELLSNHLLKNQNTSTAQRLSNFWNNLKQNPTAASIAELYDYLINNSMIITADGCFIAYKRTRENGYDHHSGTIHYAIGEIASIAREKVDEDRRRECSYGLHVGAFGYAQSFGDGKLFECKINPKDVVAVPKDSNCGKIRVCSILPIKEVDAPTTEANYRAEEEKSLPSIVDDTIILTVKNNELYIPGTVLRQIKIGVGRRANFGLLVEAIVISPRKRELERSGVSIKSYVVDRRNSVKLSHRTLANAFSNLQDGSELIVAFNNGNARIVCK